MAGRVGFEPTFSVPMVLACSSWKSCWAFSQIIAFTQGQKGKEGFEYLYDFGAKIFTYKSSISFSKKVLFALHPLKDIGN